MVRAASQRAKYGENNDLIADFATRGFVLERSRSIVHATGGPGRASRGISYSSVLINSQARLMINSYKVAAEQRQATFFCPLIITTVDGVARRASLQGFLEAYVVCAALGHHQVAPAFVFYDD